MELDLSSLVTFSAVARHKSISAAAKELHTVQSNVTTRLKQLEANLGVTLLKRHSRGVTLTTAGTRLLAYSQQLIALATEAEAAVCGDSKVRGTLRIGTTEATAASRLPPVVAQFHKDQPDIQLEICVGSTVELLKDLLAYRLDGVLVTGPVQHPDLSVELVIDDELVLVAPRGMSDIAEWIARGGLTVVTFRQGCIYRQRLESCFHERGWLPFRVVEIATLEGILGCVQNKVGVSVLPLSSLPTHPDRRGLIYKSLQPRSMHIETLFVRRNDAYFGAALRGFIATLESQVGTIKTLHTPAL